MGSREEGAEGGESWQRNGGGGYWRNLRGEGDDKRLKTGETATCRMLAYYFSKMIIKTVINTLTKGIFKCK